MTTSNRPHLLGLLAGLFVSAGLVLSAMVVTQAWLKVSESQVVTVTGSARKVVRADLVVWRGTFSAEGVSLLEVQRKLKGDLALVEAFLRDAGVTNHSVSSISIQELRGRERGVDDPEQLRTLGYRLSQSIEVATPDVDRVMRLQQDSTSLLERGVLFTSTTPEFIYTKAGEAKVEMLAEATKDARGRAEQIADQGGRVIHALRSARMGVFQITPRYSTQTSWEGMNDTTSLEKTVTAIVNATFSMK